MHHVPELVEQRLHLLRVYGLESVSRKTESVSRKDASVSRKKECVSRKDSSA